MSVCPKCEGGAAYELARSIEQEALEDWVPPAFDWQNPLAACVHLADLISVVLREAAFPAPAQE